MEKKRLTEIRSEIKRALGFKNFSQDPTTTSRDAAKNISISIARKADFTFSEVFTSVLTAKDSVWQALETAAVSEHYVRRFNDHLLLVPKQMKVLLLAELSLSDNQRWKMTLITRLKRDITYLNWSLEQPKKKIAGDELLALLSEIHSSDKKVSSGNKTWSEDWVIVDDSNYESESWRRV